jgi:hypothetical protein
VRFFEKKYWKWFILPSPKDLGMTDHDALPMRGFGNPTGGPTWEDWEEKVKKMRPFRFWLVETFTPWITRTYRRLVKNPIYWLKCHLLSKYKYHILDLRQPKEDGKLAYRYGWIDCDTQIVLALFNILNKFVANELPRWYVPSEEEIQTDASLLDQRRRYLEIRAIHYWWNVERKRQEKAQNEILHSWHVAHKAESPDIHQLWDKLKKIEKANEDKEEEMLNRLIKIRHNLWS